MANPDIGYIDRAKLAALLPERVPIRRSSKEGARYPLYVAFPMGPVPMNSPSGQNALLEYGVFYGPADEPGESEPAVLPAVPVKPAPAEAAEPGKPEEKPEEKPEKTGFFDWLMGDDDE